MSNSTAAALAATALQEYLLANLPAQVTTKNADRAATLTTPTAGPFTIPASAVLKVTLDGSTSTSVTLTSGSRTAAQIASEIDTAMGADVASATTDGRLKLTSTTAPSGTISSQTNSIVGVAEDTTGANSALGFDVSGFKVTRAPLIAPTHQGVLDGEPLVLPPLANGRMILVFGDRKDDRFDSKRREERLCRIEVRVYVPCATQDYHASREEIQSACACVINVLMTTNGRQFATDTANNVGIGFTDVLSCEVAGSTFKTPNDVNFYFDQARMIVTARVYQRSTL